MWSSMKSSTRNAARAAAVLAVTLVASLGLIAGPTPAPHADAATWHLTGEVYYSYNACDRMGRWYVYEFKKDMGNGEYLGWAAYDCRTVGNPEDGIILALLGWVKK